MKIILLITVFFYHVGTVYADWTEDHRFNPFQFPLPEYNLKAKTIKLKNLDSPPDNYKSVKLLGHSSVIPKAVKIQASKVILNPLYIDALDGNKVIFIMNKEKDDFILCSAENRKITMDYCSAFSSRRDYFFKLWTLTPADLEKKEYIQIGYSWLVHQKGSIFQFVEKLIVYEKDDFTFFRKNMISDNSSKVTFHISNNKTDELYSVSFVTDDEEIIMNFIRSFH